MSLFSILILFVVIMYAYKKSHPAGSEEGEQSYVVCPKCGVQVDPGYSFCPSCGYSFTGDTPAGVFSEVDRMDEIVDAEVLDVMDEIVEPAVDAPIAEPAEAFSDFNGQGDDN